ncbi:MAG: YIP1 family protein [Planctomycetaceae bacterium]|nr:YIP1 family protein [Planctomycetaceae bacterium]
MPIEFPCPACHQQVRTPDAAAGKKGKCPNCGAVVIIPAPVVAWPATTPPPKTPAPQPPKGPPEPKPAPPPPKSQSQPPPKPQSRPPDPARMPPSKPASAAPPPSTAAPPTSAAPASASIEFNCPTCKKIVRTPAAAAGKKGQCPHCQAVVQIPTRSTAASKPLVMAKPLPSAKPIAPKPAAPPQPELEIIDLEEMPASGPATGATPGLTPLGSGLTPLGGGLTPLGPAPPTSGGLIPLGPAPTASASDPFAGLTPLSSYPAVTPPANPLGLPPSALIPATNPYASSAAAYQPYQARTISDSHRRGLAWERDPSMDAFTETMTLVLGSPQEAFSNMRRTGGLGNPIGFMIIGTVIGQIANTIYYGIIGGFIQAAASQAPFPIERLILAAAIQLVGGVIMAVILGPILMLVIAGIHHMFLVIVSGANAGYEATFRCLCFVSGSTSILFAIPCVGPLLYPFFAIIVLIHAFANAHETSGGKAAFSVLGVLFGLVICGCGCGIMFILPAIASAMNQLP